jgi:hypothetical protein
MWTINVEKFKDRYFHPTGFCDNVINASEYCVKASWEPLVKSCRSRIIVWIEYVNVW